jgi:hypothetical protein
LLTSPFCIQVDPDLNIQRSERRNVLREIIKPTNERKGDTKEIGEEIVRFCSFCRQALYKDSKDCKEHCVDFNDEQKKIITTGEKPKKESISPKIKTTSIDNIKIDVDKGMR